MHSLITHNPHYGTQGRPYTVLAAGFQESYWTQAEAYAVRDRLLDAGAAHVRVLGLPTTVLAVGWDDGDDDPLTIED